MLDSGEVKNTSTKAELRSDVTNNAISAMDRFEEDRRYDNFQCLEPLLKRIEWFSPEEDAIRKVWEAKMSWNLGDARVAETKMKGLLDLTKQKNWKDARRAASRALSSINTK